MSIKHLADEKNMPQYEIPQVFFQEMASILNKGFLNFFSLIRAFLDLILHPIDEEKAQI